MKRRDLFFLTGVLVISAILGMSAAMLPMVPKTPFQKAVADRQVKIKMLEIVAMPGSVESGFRELKTGYVWETKWKTHTGEPMYSETFIEWNGGYGVSGDVPPVKGWGEVE